MYVCVWLLSDWSWSRRHVLYVYRKLVEIFDDHWLMYYVSLSDRTQLYFDYRIFCNHGVILSHHNLIMLVMATPHQSLKKRPYWVWLKYLAPTPPYVDYDTNVHMHVLYTLWSFPTLNNIIYGSAIFMLVHYTYMYMYLIMIGRMIYILTCMYMYISQFCLWGLHWVYKICLFSVGTWQYAELVIWWTLYPNASCQESCSSSKTCMY